MSHSLYVLSVWLHVLAATLWLGGMLFLVVVVIPLLRQTDRRQAAAFMHRAGLRFRTVGWICFAVFIATGTYQLAYRGVAVSDFWDPVFLRSSFGSAIAWKLALFVVVLALSVWHDFFLGPRATEVGRRDPSSPEAVRLRHRASWLGRANALLALAIVALAVTLVRGCP